VLVGTHRSNDLVLADTTISRFHCELIVRSDGRVQVRDLDSTNGTALDGTQVMNAFVRHGAKLRLGRTELRFELGTEQVRIPLSEHDRFGRMVGRSVAMRAVFAVLERAAQSSATVLLMGETGTGKDIAAEMLHASGPRAAGPFAVVDCGALPANLIESELFGHERGAFTGADRSRTGAFETANGGTLFLDEIGELPLDLQPKLLRVLESRQVQRIGSSQRQPVDVRVIAATNRNLWAEVNARRFRSDLYYRLAVVKVSIPSLRERLEDLPLLVDSMLRVISDDDARRAALATPELYAQLSRHSWPGNIRELRNYLERRVALDVPLPVEDQELAPTHAQVVNVNQPLAAAREQWVRAFERQYARALLARHGDNVSAAARAAGVDRTSFHRLLSRCGIGPRKRDD